MEFEHTSVLPDECMEALQIKGDGIYVDGTLGGGGHSSEIAKRLTSGKLYAFDQDMDAIAFASERLKPFGDKCEFIYSNFSHMKEELAKRDVHRIDGLLLDLGVSSYQLDEAQRGFSYMQDARLDMRMDKAQPSGAYELVNEASKEELADILWNFGEERYSRRIAERIVTQREIEPIATTLALVEVIRSAMPAKAKQEKQHPAKRSFQALRIAVNRELDIIESTLRDAVSILNPGGRIAVISFHSLEDRIVKNTFRDMSIDCICPPEFPVCRCDHRATVKLITRKPIVSQKIELEENARARSAKLRVAERLT